jgi:hypothetical protein
MEWTEAPSPFGQFYIMYKIHKEQREDGSWPTRAVCSDVTSYPHILGKWVLEQLQPVAQCQPSYFKDSFELKKMLDDMELPPNAKLFTADAVSMYTNIKTEPALLEISEYLRSHKSTPHHLYDPDSLIAVLEIVFRNNYFKLGDSFWKQISGTGMGVCPPPPWATLFFALLENKELPKWASCIMFYKRFIDDILGIWLCDPDPIKDQENWTAFQAAWQTWHGLEWEFTEQSTSVNFMDLTISVRNTSLHTTVYAKKENLYLYLPPHSSHPKGCFTGIVLGMVLWVWRLCTDKSDADHKIEEFLHQLLARGHTRTSLTPLFIQAEANAATYMARSPKEHEAILEQKKEEGSKQLYFHLQHHPEDPKARAIQELWTEYVSHLPGQPAAALIKNKDGDSCGIDKLVVAYSRPLNLRNRFSVRNIHGRGRPVSQFLAG